MAVITYKCPNCGGGLIFNPNTQKYRCEYCLSDFTQEELEELWEKQGGGEEDETEAGAAESEQAWVSPEDVGAAGAAKSERAWVSPEDVGAAGAAESEHARVNPERFGATGAVGPEGSEEGPAAAEPAQADAPVLYTCPNCGAQIVTDKTTAATFCYYCHNPVVLSERLEGSFAPDYVIPFQIDRKKAEEIFSKWIGRKRYVPEAFYNKSQIESMTGVYFPYWIYGCKVDGHLKAQGTRLRVWTTGDLRYTETKLYEVERQGTMDIDHVARAALSKANRELVDGVLPYRMEEKKEFSMGYLSGFVAENRDMEKNQFVKEVQTEVKEFALSSLQSQVGGYNSLNVELKMADLKEEEWRYALLPVWTLTYNDKARGKIYYFALNGQTGKICGELPVDDKKLARLFLCIFLPMLVLLLIGGYFL